MGRQTITGKNGFPQRRRFTMKRRFTMNKRLNTVHAPEFTGLIPALAGLITVATLGLAPARPVSAQAVAPSWSYTGNLNAVRMLVPATLLPGGKVLIAGGGGPPNDHDMTAELYDTATGTWSVTGSAPPSLLTDSDRAFGIYHHTATLLPNGKVLVAGGSMDDGSFTSAVLYDPATGTWSSTGSLIAH